MLAYIEINSSLCCKFTTFSANLQEKSSKITKKISLRINNINKNSYKHSLKKLFNNNKKYIKINTNIEFFYLCVLGKKFIISLIPISIGDIVELRCMGCGAMIDVTEMEKF